MSINDFDIDNGVLSDYSGYRADVVIPDGVTEIEGYVFNDNDSVRSVSIPDSIKSIDESNFKDCPNLRFNERGGARYLGNEKNPYLVLVSGFEDIEDCVVADGCKIIMGNAFHGNTKLLYVELPQSLRYIGFMAFYGCESLRDVELPEGLIGIDSCAFEDCALTAIALPDTLCEIGRDAFSCVTLKEVTLPESVSRIGSGAFTGNTLKFNEYNGGYYIGSRKNPYLCFMKTCDCDTVSVRVHGNCRIIYSDAFKRNGNLETVVLPAGLTSIGSDAFRECKSLIAINLPCSVELIGECAFASCESLSDIKLPEGKTEVESGAFLGCCSLEEIELNSAVVGDNAFSGCTGLKRVTVGGGSNLYGDYIFSDCTSLEEVILPERLRGRFDEEEFSDSPNVKIIYAP